MNVCERFDFPHAPVWCPECYAEATQTIIAREATRANDLKEQEIKARIDGYWQEPEVQVVRQYTPPRQQPPPAPINTSQLGGISIEPRHRSIKS